MAASTTTTANDTTDYGDDDIFGDEPDEDEDEEGVITGVGSRKQRRIVLTKRTYLLIAFLVVTVLSLAAAVYVLVFYLDEYDFPPTDYSFGSFRDTLIALYMLAGVTPVGFVILKFRITNLLIGVSYLFLLVICLVFPLKGIAFAVYSLTEDTEFNIHQYAKNPNNENNKLHNFWAAFQQQYGCCGTKEIDRVEDWSYFLNSTDLPASCCSESQIKYARSLELLSRVNEEFGANLATHRKPELSKESSYCGRGLARTRTRGLGFGNQDVFKRVYSGFFLSLSEKEKDAMKVKFVSPSFDDRPGKILVQILDAIDGQIKEMKSTAAFMKIWKNFYADNVCNQIEDLKKIDQTLAPPENIDPGVKSCANIADPIPNDIAYPSDINIKNPIEAVGVIEKIDYEKTYNNCIAKAFLVYNKTNVELKKANEYASAEEYCKAHFPKLRESANTIGRELLLQLDYLTTYIYELGKRDSDSNIVSRKNTWILWPIPLYFNSTDTHPYKLVANYLRVEKPHDPADKHKLKKMYYFSRGIAENFVLEDVIHPRTCESLDPKHIPGIKTKIARDMNRRWRKGKPFSEWKNKEEGLGKFFVAQVHKIAWATLGVSSCCIFFVVFIFVVFWLYYSRIKAEEYANLALPKEFEVLHLRRGSLIDEEDIARDMSKFKRIKRFIARKKVGPTATAAVAAAKPQKRPGQKQPTPAAAPPQALPDQKQPAPLGQKQQPGPPPHGHQHHHQSAAPPST